jgi:hypothetical protein
LSIFNLQLKGQAVWRIQYRMRKLMLGNEAIARGLVENGCTNGGQQKNAEGRLAGIEDRLQH